VRLHWKPSQKQKMAPMAPRAARAGRLTASPAARAGQRALGDDEILLRARLLALTSPACDGLAARSRRGRALGEHRTLLRRVQPCCVPLSPLPPRPAARVTRPATLGAAKPCTHARHASTPSPRAGARGRGAPARRHRRCRAPGAPSRSARGAPAGPPAAPPAAPQAAPARASCQPPPWRARPASRRAALRSTRLCAPLRAGHAAQVRTRPGAGRHGPRERGGSGSALRRSGAGPPSPSAVRVAMRSSWRSRPRSARRVRRTLRLAASPSPSPPSSLPSPHASLSGSHAPLASSSSATRRASPAPSRCSAS